MDDMGRSVRRHLARARDVEWFVRLIVAGGITLVAGLWIAALSTRWSPVWIGGGLLAVIGLAALGRGLWSEVSY